MPGIGADGLILVTPGDDGADVEMTLLNADGSIAEMSGNGIRTLANGLAINSGATFHAGLLRTASIPVHEVLELGSGGGHNAFHLKRSFALTLVDLSEEMLAVSRAQPGMRARARATCAPCDSGGSSTRCSSTTPSST
jgi:SAM-dependent methyltransferase